MINFGIIGAGNIAHKFADAIKRVENATLIAVASKSLERAEKWAEEENIALYYSSYEDMLKNKEIDAIYIATTNNFHHENIIMALNANKHVICEKPMFLSQKAADEIISLAKAKNLFLMEGMWTRFLPKTNKICEWISTNRIGKIHLMQANIGWKASIVHNKRLFDKSLGGGSLWDLAVYPLELLPYFINKPIKNVHGNYIEHTSGVNDILNINLDFDECLANIQASFTTKLTEDAYIFGETGYIKIPKFHFGNNAYLYNENDEIIESFNDTTKNGFIFELQEMISCIEKGDIESKICPLQMSLDTAKIYDNIRNN